MSSTAQYVVQSTQGFGGRDASTKNWTLAQFDEYCLRNAELWWEASSSAYCLCCGAARGRGDGGAQPLNRTPFCATACAATRLPTRASAAVSLLSRGARGISGKKRCTNLLAPPALTSRAWASPPSLPPMFAVRLAGSSTFGPSPASAGCSRGSGTRGTTHTALSGSTCHTASVSRPCRDAGPGTISGATRCGRGRRGAGSGRICKPGGCRPGAAGSSPGGPTRRGRGATRTIDRWPVGWPAADPNAPETSTLYPMAVQFRTMAAARLSPLRAEEPLVFHWYAEFGRERSARPT